MCAGHAASFAQHRPEVERLEFEEELTEEETATVREVIEAGARRMKLVEGVLDSAVLWQQSGDGETELREAARALMADGYAPAPGRPARVPEAES